LAVGRHEPVGGGWPRPSLFGTLTVTFLNSGRNFATGSVSCILPSSTRIMAPTEASGFVIE